MVPASTQTKIVSRPAPVYYAHRAAFLGPYYDRDYRDSANGSETSSSGRGGHGSTVSTNVGQVREDLRNLIYYA